MTNLKYVVDVDEHSELHLARLIILIVGLTKRKEIKKINGITKLVQLDFLLRYPAALKRALEWVGNAEQNIFRIEKYEWSNVESSMIRFKYGPWDKRYRNFLATLESYGLLRIEKIKETIFIELTKKGEEIGIPLSNESQFQSYVERTAIIKKNFEVMSGTELKKLMFEIIPEIETTKHGDAIIF